MKKVRGIAVAVLLLHALFVPAPVCAQDEIRILDSSVVAEFPLRLTFKLSAESAVNITDIRLCYQVVRESFADVTSEAFLSFTPGRRVDVSWTLEMLKIGGLPPGTVLDYWWLVMDADGRAHLATKPASVKFNDLRYPWQSLSANGITLYWYDGDRAFAEELMASAVDALARLKGDTGATLAKPVELYIYANSNDLRGSMINPQEWTGGVAFSRHGIITIGIAKNGLEWGKRAVAHELTHLVVHQVTANPYHDLPTWLDEGLAMHTEGPLGADFASYLNKAVTEGGLISVRSLASPFSAYSDRSYLSYAESFSIVDFLIGKYGQEKMLELLLAIREGNSYDGALQKVYGFDMDGLNTIWQNYIRQPARIPDAGGVPILRIAAKAVFFLVMAPCMRIYPVDGAGF
ncbi:MAG: peptidase MA family metallohydrolase [Chloroflexota bacterium]